MNPQVLEELLEEGLDDWVPLISVASAVNRHLRLEEDQVCSQMTTTVRSLVDNDTFRVGTVTESQGFQALGEPLDDLLRRVCDDWSTAEEGDWWWACWLEITDRGRALARSSFPHLTS